MAITCDQTGMSLEFDRCIYTAEPRDSITLAFENENCTSTTFDDQFLISTPLDDCSTTATVEGGEIVFKNTVSVKYRWDYNAIVLNSDVNIDVQCRFNAFVSDVSSDSFENSPAIQQAGASGSASFRLDADFYTDSSFSEISSDVQMVGEKVFFGITQATKIDGLSFVVEDCLVGDRNFVNSFYVFEDFCPNKIVNNDEVTTEFETTDMFKLSYHAFQFSGNYDKEIVSMNMYCSIYTCLFDSCPVDQKPCN